MLHPFPGFSGALTAVAVFIVLYRILRSRKKFDFFNLGPGGDTREYEPIMNRYIRLAEFMIGAATGSIVLVVGSSALHGTGGRLAWFFGSPLILLAMSVVYGIGFMASQILTYEDVLHGNPHTAESYTLNESLGFSALACFVLGYLWLIFSTTNM